MDGAPELPVPIFFVNGRYLLFSVDVVSYLRKEHHVCGVLIGTIPHFSQQNVFLGLPLELMPEETLLLAENDVAYVVDDTRAHDQGLQDLGNSTRTEYLARILDENERASKAMAGRKEQLRRKTLNKNAPSSKMEEAIADKQSDAGSKISNRSDKEMTEQQNGAEHEKTLLTTEISAPKGPSNLPQLLGIGVTPATSEALLPTPRRTVSQISPEALSSYPLFAHLHKKGYYLSPGLRFGCKYLVYPGDPLRFHSHFLAESTQWDDEIDLMEIVGGGRLGTGVKKSFLLGGATPVFHRTSEVRTFSIEWAGM